MNRSSAVPHSHIFLGAGHDRNERKLRAVIWLCLVMMAIEIVGGTLFGSLALVADGLHMSTHALALIIAAAAYRYARRHAEDARFSFGTGKLGDLAGFTSAIVLAIIALFILYEAASRLLTPVAIEFGEAIPIAALGLVVNSVSAWLLGGDDDHGHAHGHSHHAHRDNNMRAAFVHIAADAGISLMALVGLGAARIFGWNWLDPAMGIVGALVIANWSWGLVRDTGGVLLDMTPDPTMESQMRQVIEAEGDELSDFHLWRLGPGHLGAILSITTAMPRGPDFYRARLWQVDRLSHVTIEVQGTAHAP
jgi:cation diffusion facilitator family transporter